MNWIEFIKEENSTKETVLGHAGLGYFHPNGDEIVTVEHQLELVHKLYNQFEKREKEFLREVEELREYKYIYEGLCK